MKKNLLLLLLFVFSFSAIHADDIKWEISDDGTLTISGTGDMPNYSPAVAPWYSRREEIKKVVIKDGVTNVGEAAFRKFPNIVSAIIGNSVTTIGERAFVDCSSLTSVTMSNSVTSIKSSAFGNSGLTSIVIPNSVTTIEGYAFAYCLGLTSVEIPNSVKSIGHSAFYGCSNLTSVTIGNSVTSIGGLAFLNGKNITSITFKGSIPPTFGAAFCNNKPTLIYVPNGSVDAYKKALALESYSLLDIHAIPLSLNFKNNYTQDSQMDGANVYYTRTFLGYWEALYLPFSLKYEDWKDDFEVARINAVRQYDDDNDGDIDRTIVEFVKMKSGSVIVPNTPYLIKAKEAGEKTFHFEDITVYKAEEKSIECSTTNTKFTFTGTYKVISFLNPFNKKDYYILDGKGLNVSKGTLYLLPYQWYLEIKDRNSAYGIKNNMSKEISISVVGEETTGVSELRMTNDELPVYESSVYDLNGRKVNENNLKPGIYVKNGKKFIIK